MREEQPADMLARLGSDGLLWAQEFNKIAVRLGYSEMDEGWLTGWFANAIENSCNPFRNECYRLREENARLREENDAWRMDGGSCAEEVKRLRAENARLRVERDKAAEEMWKASDQAQAFRKIIERMPAQSAIVKLAEQQAEIERLREEVERLKSEESCNDVLLECAQAETQRLRDIVCKYLEGSMREKDIRAAAAAIREGGGDD